MCGLKNLQVKNAINSTVSSLDLREADSDKSYWDHRILGHDVDRKQNMPEDSPWQVVLATGTLQRCLYTHSDHLLTLQIIPHARANNRAIDGHHVQPKPFKRELWGKRALQDAVTNATLPRQRDKADEQEASEVADRRLWRWLGGASSWVSKLKQCIWQL